MQTSQRPLRVGVLSVHTSPLVQPGAGDAGGMNVYVDRLVRGLADLDIVVDVFTRRTGADLPDSVSVNDRVTVHHLSAGLPSTTKTQLPSYLCSFAQQLEHHTATRHVSLWHSHYWLSGWVGRHIAARTATPLLHTFHTLARQKNAAAHRGAHPEPILRVHAEDRIATGCAHIVSPTSTERRFLPTGHADVTVIEPGVDTEVFSPAAARGWTKALLNPSGDAQVMLFVGRLQPLKGPDTAVRILAEVLRRAPDDHPPIRLVIVGGPSGRSDGCDPDSLFRLASELGVENHVAFLSPRKHGELAALYAEADLLLMPSHAESFGLVALEAQACGTPVVATYTDGLRRVVGPIEGNYGGGTLVTEYTPEAFADAAIRYLTDSAATAQAAAAGVRRATSFSWRVTAQKTAQVYHRCVANMH